MKSKFLVSAGVSVYINGTLFGVVNKFSFKSKTPNKGIYSLDRAHPHEYSIEQTEMVGSMGVYREFRDGGMEGRGLASPFDALSRLKYFSIDLLDQASGDLMIFHADRCVVEDQTWAFVARQRVEGEILFKGISWHNESYFRYFWNDVKPDTLE